jgi:tetratricopeptide (TPR) repeat protein
MPRLPRRLPCLAFLLIPLLLLGTGASPSPAPEDGFHWPWTDPSLARATQRFFALLYDMDYEACTALVDSLDQERPDDPLVTMLRARILRDLIREVDVTRKTREAQFRLMKGILDDMRRRARKRLERDPDDPLANLSLGWAGMMEGQVQIMLKDYWGANATTREARAYVEKVLEWDPRQPDAMVLLGGYLYMVDTLPRFLKLIRWIPFLPIPSGNREEGLRLLLEGMRGAVPTATDYQIYMAFVDIFYEGDFQRARGIFGPLYEAHPQNPRFGIALALMAPFAPENGLAAVRIWERLSREWARRATGEPKAFWWQGWDRWSITLALRIKLMAAYQWEALGRVAEAGRLYEELLADPMGQFRRVRGPALLGLARTEYLQRRPAEARRLLERLLASKALDDWHGLARDLEDWIEDHPVPTYPLTRWREAGEPLLATLRRVEARDTLTTGSAFTFSRSSLREMEALCASASRPDPVLRKLLADAYLLAGLPEKALDAYREALHENRDPSLWAVRLQANLSWGYLLEQLGRFREAEKAYERADKLLVEPDLHRYPLDARRDAVRRARKRHS